LASSSTKSEVEGEEASAVRGTLTVATPFLCALTPTQPMWDSNSHPPHFDTTVGGLCVRLRW
jgi:hypothetical protein